MNMRDTQILNARRKASESHGYYCNLRTQVHVGCEHGNSTLSTERVKERKSYKKSNAEFERLNQLDRQARRHYDNGDHDYSMNG